MKAATLFMTLYLSLWFSEIRAQEKQIEVVNSNELVFDELQSEAKKLIGQVILKHENAIMHCDSAYLYEKDNKFEAFGNVHIQQGDSLTLRSRHLIYEGTSKLAHADGNVELTRRSMVIQTDRLDYDLKKQTADYHVGAQVRHGLSQLTSQSGTYNNHSRSILFRKEVVLLNPEYTIRTDSMLYQTEDEIASFFGFTRIITKEKDTIQCHRGWYDTRNDKARFWRRALIISGPQKLYADSITYNNKLGKGNGYRNIYFRDNQEHISFTGQIGIYQKRNGSALITGNPIALRLTDGDSVFTSADTLLYIGDSLAAGGRKMLAFHNVNIYKSDFQGTADSISYALTDSVIRMYYNPILYHKENQLNADTIFLFQKNNKPDYLKLMHHSFICSRERGNHFNQIQGKYIHAYFDSSELSNVKVFQEGESIYYLKEDSNHYTGINQIRCDSMDILLEEKNIKSIRFFMENKGTIHPVKNADPKKLRLGGFNWQPKRRPEKPTYYAPEN